jgi:hypothetical protein
MVFNLLKHNHCYLKKGNYFNSSYLHIVEECLVFSDVSCFEYILIDNSIFFGAKIDSR